MKSKGEVQVVLIEDNKDDALLTTLAIQKGGFTYPPIVIEKPTDLTKVLDQQTIDLVISDYNLLGYNALDALDILKKHPTETPFILLSGAIGEQMAVEAMKAGANDYIMKDNMARLCVAMERELRDAQVRLQKTKAEKELAEARQRQQLMFEKHASAMVIINANTLMVEDANPAAMALFGATNPNHLIGKTITQLHSAPPSEVALRYNKAAHNLINFATWQLNMPQQPQRSIEEYITPIDTNGTTTLLCIMQDVTQRIETEQNLEMANKKVAVRTIELDSFVYRVSHNLRAPLCSILGLINVARLTDQKDSLCLDYLSKIENRVEQLDNYIKDVLMFSKNMNVAPQFSPNNLIKIFNEITQQLQYQLENSPVLLTHHIPDEVVHIDAWRFSEILKALISNSIKFYDAAKEKPNVRVEIETKPTQLQITVTDNGIGIKPDILPKIKGMFFRGETHYDGSGLGLYIVSQGVEMLNGTLNIQSQYGNGTQVIVTLPTA